MANFPPIQPLLPIFRRLQPELIPVTAVGGSFTAGVGAGVITATGTQGSNTIGQGFAVGAGLVVATGGMGGLSLGTLQGFNVGAGLVTGFGYNAIIAPATATPTPTPSTPTSIAAFAPALSELSLDAWERLGMQAGELTTTHLNSMRRSMNLVLVRWANNGLNLWEVANATLTLVPGVATYALPLTLIEMLDTYVRTTFGTVSSDIIITPMSRNTYAGLPNKAQPGRPVLYWFDRTITPSVTVWPVPDTIGYTMPYFGWSQIADADPSQGNTANLPYRFLEAFTAGVASHLAMKWAPERAEKLKAYSDEVFIEAADEDVENVTLSMVPDFGPYFN